jgi:hypothetical protein
MCALIVIIFLFIRHFLCKKVIGLQIAHLSRFSSLLIPFMEIGSFPFILFELFKLSHNVLHSQCGLHDRAYSQIH